MCLWEKGSLILSCSFCLWCAWSQITWLLSGSSIVSLSYCTFSAGEKQFSSLTWASMARFQELWESLPQRECQPTFWKNKTTSRAGLWGDGRARTWQPHALREKASFLPTCWCGQIWNMALLWWCSDTGYFKTLSIYCQQEAQRVLVSAECICMWLGVVIMFFWRAALQEIGGVVNTAGAIVLKHSGQRRKGKEQARRWTHGSCLLCLS